MEKIGEGGGVTFGPQRVQENIAAGGVLLLQQQEAEQFTSLAAFPDLVGDGAAALPDGELSQAVDAQRRGVHQHQFVEQLFGGGAARAAQMAGQQGEGGAALTLDEEGVAALQDTLGGFIPGIRPGRPTADYLRYVLSRITLPGSIYLGVIAVLPNLFLQIGASGGVQNLPFGGTAVLIMIGVGLDTVKQIESQLQQRNYEGFLR